MSERTNFEKFSRFTKEDREFFNALVERYERYGVRQDTEYIIIDKDNREIRLLKSLSMPVGSEGKEIPIEKYLRRVLELDESEER